jgi:hypothetical protein
LPRDICRLLKWGHTWQKCMLKCCQWTNQPDCQWSLFNGTPSSRSCIGRIFIKAKILSLNKLILLCAFTFWVPCCDFRYDIRIKTMFGSSLPPVVCRRAHVYLRYLCLFTHSGVTYCVVFLFCFSSSSCCQFLWIVIFWLPFGIL